MNCIACLAASVSLFLSPSTPLQESFIEPIDAVSIVFPANSTDEGSKVRSRTKNGTWSEWQDLEVNDEQDPGSRVSNLIVFPKPVSDVEVKTSIRNIQLQPIRVSKAPTSYKLAAVSGNFGTPKILSRSEWGADESLRITKKPAASSSSSTNPTITQSDNGEVATGRVADCEQMQFDYPGEFKTDGTSIKTDADGNRYLWPQTFSKSIKLFVVHHTAMGVSSDTRSGVERMRALYQYHAASKGWGDVGYRYIIDEAGQVYEGRAGGDKVVSGHAYCNNINTLGIALMGNFESEKPTQAQAKALQWLLNDLASKNNVSLSSSVTYHGKTFASPIVGHKDLLSTSCPGFYIYGSLDQIRAHAKTGQVDLAVTFPEKPEQRVSDKPYVNGVDARRNARMQNAGVTAPASKVGLQIIGATTLAGRPGEQTLISIGYVAGSAPVAVSKSLGAIERSEGTIGLWLDRNGEFERLRNTLPSPERINANEELTMRLKVQFPMDEGTYTFSVGKATYTLEASGRRMRDVGAAPSVQTYTRPETPRVVNTPRSSSSVSSRSSSSISSRSSSSVSSDSSDSSPTIRVRLTITENPSITLSSSATIGGQSFNAGALTLGPGPNTCIASQNGRTVSSGILRIDAGSSITSVGDKKYRGILECRIVDNVLTLINELPLETYLHGVSEEPDTEPYEKQRAFAIAARSYALFYLSPSNRKFPGKPYDASDSAALFQKYTGVTFEQKHLGWVRAVDETRGKVLTKNNQVLKLPYFTSDNGMTKSPADIGWNNFPFAEVFAAKPDPWCEGYANAGHGVGMSGCGSRGQAKEGKTAEQILEYYYPGTVLKAMY